MRWAKQRSALIGAEYGFATATWDAGRCRQMGQKRTSIDASLMSAPPSTADVHPSLEGGWDVQVGSDGAIKLRWSRKPPFADSSPFAPPHNLKRQFWLEFNNYLRAALTLRGVSSAKCRALPVHATSALSLPTVWKLRSSTESGLLSPVAYRQPGNTSDSVRHAEPV